MSLVDTSKPTHLNVGGTIRTIIPDELIKSEREETTYFTNLFSNAPVTTSSTFGETVYFVNYQVDIFNMIVNWLKYGLINKELSQYQRSELIIACQEMHCLNLLKVLGSTKVKLSDVVIGEIVKFGNLELGSLNLSGQDLKGLDLKGFKKSAKLLFKESNLSNANLTGCTFKSSDFSKSDLSNADLTGSEFTQCDFTSAKLSAANLKDAKFTDCTFDKSDLSDANFTGTSFNSECSFNSTVFLNTVPEFTDVNHSTFKFIDSRTEFNDMRFNGVFFTREYLENRTFTNCVFYGCYFWEHGGKGTFSRCRYYECNNGDTPLEQLLMCQAYSTGQEDIDLGQDFDKALKFLKSSHEQGLEASSSVLGVLHYFGLGVPKDRSLACSLLSIEEGSELDLKSVSHIAGCDECNEGIVGYSHACSECNYDCCESCWNEETKCKCGKPVLNKSHLFSQFLSLIKHFANPDDTEVGNFISNL